MHKKKKKHDIWQIYNQGPHKQNEKCYHAIFFFFVHLMLNSKKCPKNDSKMHKELQVDDKNMMFGMFATNNHTKNTAYGIIRFFNLCLFYV
mgnify:FL=1